MDTSNDKIGITKPYIKTTVDVIVGVVAYRAGSYIIDEFMANQKDIQRNHPSSALVFATNESDFATELRKALDQRVINGSVLYYETVRPHHARSKFWNVACGREAIRQYILKETAAEYLQIFDSDMTYDSNVIDIMKKELRGYDIAYSGYALRDFGIALAGTGCCMLTTELLKAFQFRCLEFKNGTVITEDTLLELDLMRLGMRIKKGFFISINHYYDSLQAKSVSPQHIGLYRRITHSAPVRRVLIRASIVLRHDVGWGLSTIVFKACHFIKEIPFLRKN